MAVQHLDCYRSHPHYNRDYLESEYSYYEWARSSSFEQVTMVTKVKTLLNPNPMAVKLQDCNDRFPLHWVCKYKQFESVIKVIEKTSYCCPTPGLSRTLSIAFGMFIWSVAIGY
jgi:hypothetical protein